MAEKLDIIFISDVACPWCLVGLRNMEAALDELAGEIEAQIRFAPFELNPTCRPKASIAAPILPKNTGCPRKRPKRAVSRSAKQRRRQASR